MPETAFGVVCAKQLARKSNATISAMQVRDEIKAIASSVRPTAGEMPAAIGYAGGFQ
jgi:hypothetical protein